MTPLQALPARLGNARLGLLLRAGLARAKLRVASANDPLEAEADRVADAVTDRSGTDSTTLVDQAASSPARVQPKCAECEEEDAEERRIQRKTVSSSPAPAEAPESVSRVLDAPGRPLDAAVRAEFEPRFRRDFSSVRIHDGPAASESAASVNARAYTVGQSVVFGAGEYAPQTDEGRHLLAHELTHVVQQDGLLHRDPLDGGVGVAPSPAPSTSSSTIAPPGDAAPAPTSAPTEAPPTSEEEQKIEAIQRRLTASTASGLGKLFDWVGPFDRMDLVELWNSFGPRLPAVANAHFHLFNECLKRDMDLSDLTALDPMRDALRSDIKQIVTGYLFGNRQVVIDEMERYGLPADESIRVEKPTDRQVEESRDLQRAAAAVGKLQKAQEEARRIPVGYKSNTSVAPGPGGFAVNSVGPAYFDPYGGPPEMTTPPSGVDRLFTPTVTAEIRPYQEVRDLYDQATAMINGYLQSYPAIYAVSREGSSAKTADFAQIDDPVAARRELARAMRALIADIESAQVKLDGGRLDPLDMTPVIDHLLGGMQGPSGTSWQSRIPTLVVRDLIKDHQFEEALETLGLQVAATGLFLIAPLTGGASLLVMLGGLAVTGAQYARSSQKYEDLAQAARTAVRPGTELVTQPQVDEAQREMEADRIALALAALTVAAAATSAAIKAIRAPAPELGEPGANSTTRSSGARELKYSDYEGAERAYDVIRGVDDDVAAISRNTGWRPSWVQRVKDHLFNRTHQLDDAVRRFDADPEIVNAWRRMQNGTHTAKDIQLLQHELFESRFEGIFKTDYRTAHDAANRSGRPSGL